MNHSIYILLLPLVCIFCNSCERTLQEEHRKEPVELFEELWTTFDEEYAPFELRNVDWERQYQEFRPLVGPNTSEEELFEVMGRMLATLDDGHVSLVAPEREVFFSNTVRREKLFDGLFDLSLIREHYLDPGFQMDAAAEYLYGRLKDENIGYIFFDYIGPNVLVIEEFLEEYSQAEGFIIDLRHNKGGDFTYCFSAIGRLTDRERFVFRSKTRNGPARDDYTEWKEWSISPSGNWVDKPVAVLTDRHTISAGERSVMAFMTLPNVTVIGDTTNGAHGTMIGRELANGWYFTLVPQIVEVKEGLSYEGSGLPPDRFVRNRPEQMEQGVDSTLLTAIDRIRKGF